jgi:steroid 5-alpha reductase family enzyme
MDIQWWLLIISIGFNLLLFIPAYIFKTDKLTDLSYSLTFILLCIVGFASSAKAPGQMLVTLMVLLWAIRLGGFLFIRVNKTGKDSRFDNMRSQFWPFLRFWVFQGLTVFVVMASATALYREPTALPNAWYYLGWVVFGLGLGLEALADYQKYKFGQMKTKNAWIDSGFWRISRHPNYLGEIMVWSGIYIFVLSNLHGLARIFALASPIYIILILLFFSGIPLLEKSADKKWGANKDYQDYKNQVPVLVPTLDSLKRFE